MGVNVKKDDAILYVELDRAEAKNALDPEMMIALYEAWQELAENSELRVAVLSSALPDIFCAGMDLKKTMPVVMKVREPETDAERL